MSIYREIASKREIEEFAPILQKTGNLALVGMHGCGIRTISRYVAKNIYDNYSLVFEDDNFTFDLEILAQKIDTVEGNILIVLPTYYQKDENFKQKFQKLLEGYTGKKISTLIAINIEEYLSLKDSFIFSIKPITSVGIIKPRTKEEIFEILKEYDDLDIPLKQKELIYELSGGNPALMKRCCVAFITDKLISETNLLKDETTLIILSKLAKEYESLNLEQRVQFGFTSNTGKLKSKLLNDYFEQNMSDSSESLVDKIVKIFTKSKGNLISIEEIDSLLSAEGSFSLWNRYKVIERVREKLPAKYKLENIRNKGYRLVYGRSNKNISGETRTN
jgi:hypothetical protein